MKKLLFTLLVALICGNVVAMESSFIGKWQGDLIINSRNKLKIAFEISKLINGEYDAVMHSPDQKNFNISVDRIFIKNDSVCLEIKTLSTKFSGRIFNDSVNNNNQLLVGQLSSSGSKGLALSMNKCDEFPFKIAKRPQEPKRPYPYYTENVSFSNKNEGITLKGTFTKPFGVDKTPAVILVSGSGPSDRNQTIFGHKVFLVLADYLTRNGFAVLRYDDRGAGESGGSFRKATVKDHAADVSSAIDYLITRDDVIKSKIGLIGHSLGAEIAPIAAKLNSNTAFIVLMAGSAIPLKEVIFEQCDAIFNSLGVSKEGIALNKEILESVMEIVRVSENDSITKEGIKRDLLTFNERVSKLTDSEREKLGLSSPLKLSDYSGLLMPFMRYDLFHNPSETLKNVKCPVFALNGDKDIQVLPHNLERIADVLIKSGNKKVKAKLYRNCNHLLQNCNTGEIEEYGNIEETISEEVVSDIIKWIRNLKK